MPKGQDLIENSIRMIIVASLALIPLFFLPITQNFYDTNKLALLMVASLVLLVLWGIRIMTSRVIAVSIYPRVLAFLFLSLAALLSTIFIAPNKIEALTSPAGIAVFGTLTFIVFLGSILGNRTFERWLTWGIITSASILSLIAVYMYFGIGKLMFPGVAFLADPLWSPIGSSLALAAVLAISLPLAVDELIKMRDEKNEALLAVAAVAATIILIALAITVFQFFPKLSTNVLPLGASWAIMLEVFKDVRFLIFGVGPNGYLGAFTAARPVAFNMGPLWNARFSLSGSAVLHIATTLGLIGVAGVIVLLRALFPGRSAGETKTRIVTYAVAVLALFLTPLNIAVLAVVAGILLLRNPEETSVHSFRIPDHVGWVAQAVGVTAIGAAAVLAFLFFRFYAGEFFFYKSLKAAAASNGTETYNLQIQALTFNPYETNYHVAYAQTNLALANAIASNAQATASGQQVQLSDNDRRTISQLIQQAIREAKIGTSLSPDNIFTWETLARTYQGIINIVQGSDSWAAASYQQAIQLDPTNPSHRLNLAGIYMTQNNYDAALTQLQAAQFLKPDAAVIYYNMAFIYGQRKEYAKQAAALKQTLALLPQGNKDATQVAKELEDVKKQLSPEELKALEGEVGSGTPNQAPLTAPETSPKAEITPKLELPQEASPAVSVSPKPQPQRL